jgi:hypothetical protein
MAVIEKGFLAAILDGRAPIEAFRFVQIDRGTMEPAAEAPVSARYLRIKKEIDYGRH